MVSKVRDLLSYKCVGYGQEFKALKLPTLLEDKLSLHGLNCMTTDKQKDYDATETMIIDAIIIIPMRFVSLDDFHK